MPETILETTFSNPQAIPQHYGFLGARGRTLAAGESFSILGAPLSLIRGGSPHRVRQAMRSMQRAVQLGHLSIVSVPRPIIWDTTLTVPKAVRLDANLIASTNPNYTEDVVAIVTTTTASPTTTTTAGAAPTAPTAPTAVLANGGQEAVVGWTHAGAGTARYRIRRRITLPGGTAGSYSNVAEVLVGNLFANIDITMFESGTKIDFGIAAVSATGVASAFTADASVTRP